MSHHLALWNNLDEDDEGEDDEDEEDDEGEEEDDWTVVPRAGDIQGEKRVGRRRSRNLFSTQ